MLKNIVCPFQQWNYFIGNLYIKSIHIMFIFRRLQEQQLLVALVLRQNCERTFPNPTKSRKRKSYFRGRAFSDKKIKTAYLFALAPTQDMLQKRPDLQNSDNGPQHPQFAQRHSSSSNFICSSFLESVETFDSKFIIWTLNVITHF